VTERTNSRRVGCRKTIGKTDGDDVVVHLTERLN
jgi:hypothetical protein